MARHYCDLCEHWVQDNVIGWRRAGALLAAHRSAAHPLALVSVPPGAAQSDAAALAICRTCHKLPCACPQDVIRPAAKVGTLDLFWRFDGGLTITMHVPIRARLDASDYEALTDVLRGLVRPAPPEPIQTPGQEGNS